MIHSDKSSTSGVYRMNQIDIINSTFENIIQAEGSGSGSTINAELKTGSIMNISQSCSFANCKSRTTGGAIQTIISGGQIELNEVIIKGCKARNGGGIYINIDFSSQFEFKIINSLIQDCQAKNDQLQINHTGYGGGIFLTGTGEYNPSTKRLDLKGMKIYGNSADKSGQSLYVAMTSVKEWCNNYAFEIIYPPDDELALPILIEGDPQIFQSASFGMKDISWIDYDNKPYGILASNDKRIFTGIDGKEDQAYPLEIIIEKDDDERSFIILATINSCIRL
ncbi:MAG: hypothetical protein EZS28_006043 [Streblomastix strix]|uniref:Right handed beta helix domain-containing protein n=1 Tax=Streblomastix strix TaxID=222440 RepID=A0A5J4WW30_9EUKA|nr:MAG: hypothetical protein EZS28_006043 [Streblomastix strix]